ncbi:chemotaxis protein CheW [Adhaeribacter aerolatus]|uniref:Chemotaxis protein CheW n=1 Tax=Adhaeribacter aerolatus TaxID=670289 RepID=A0A512B1E1_9BACT|nr:chemotaxis protein CheW [Adhaeribacter aerolatus]GEO05804.1 chemotaxis protein CheW [Adhaeribacter aerolatus]
MEQEERKDKRDRKVEPMVHLIVFKLGSEEYGIRIEQVKEVTVTPEVARMPKTPKFIKGIANIRGDIIAIMDLEERFHIRLPDDAISLGNYKNTYTLTLEASDYTIGLIVREMPQSLTIPISQIDKTPAFIQDLNINENFIEGIGKINGRLIIVLDILRILTSDELQQLRVLS